MLALAAGLYFIGLLVDQKRKTLRSVRLNKPVISIGNLTWGGTGKTPLLFDVLRRLLELNKKPAVLTRGYKGWAPGQNQIPRMNDESMMLERRFPSIPIGAGVDRVQSAQHVSSSKSLDLFILDDGFQHRRVQRDLDIVCIDATNPWGGGHLIPWGQLREPKWSLKRAQVVVLTRCELVSDSALEILKSEIQKRSPQALIVTSRFAHQLVNWRGHKTLATILNGQKVLALSAIGNPQAFENNLRAMGAHVIPLRYSDHHFYGEGDLREIEARMHEHQAWLVTTEKDEIKLRESRWGRAHETPAHLYVLQAEITFSPDDESKLNRKLADVAHA